MKIIAHVNRRSVYIGLLALIIVFFSILYSHIFSGSFRNGLYYNVFGEATPYVGYILFILGGYYFASMLWADQAYLTSDGIHLIEFRGSKIKLCEIVDVGVTRKKLGIKNITITGKFHTIDIRSYLIQEDSAAIVNAIKDEAKLP
jgi:hypothetical protein